MRSPLLLAVFLPWTSSGRRYLTEELCLCWQYWRAAVPAQRAGRHMLGAAGGRNSLIWKCSWGTGRSLSHPGQVWPEGGGRGVSRHVSAPRWETICRGGLAAEHPKARELGERSSQLLDWIPCPSSAASILPQPPEGD